MRELYPDPEKEWKPKVRRFLLDQDARIDTALFQAGRWARELYERFSMFMDRFHVAGWRRWLFIEPLSEGATLGVVGLIGHAGAGAAGVPRDRRRRLAEEARNSRSPSSTATATRSAAAASSTTIRFRSTSSPII